MAKLSTPCERNPKRAMLLLAVLASAASGITACRMAAPELRSDRALVHSTQDALEIDGVRLSRQRWTWLKPGTHVVRSQCPQTSKDATPGSTHASVLRPVFEAGGEYIVSCEQGELRLGGLER